MRISVYGTWIQIDKRHDDAARHRAKERKADEWAIAELDDRAAIFEAEALEKLNGFNTEYAYNIDRAKRQVENDAMEMATSDAMASGVVAYDIGKQREGIEV